MSDGFGRQVEFLPNGNIVITDPDDSSVDNNAGAVHLFDGSTLALIASIYGDDADDQLGSGGIYVLTSGDFVIASPSDDEGGVTNAGSVQLIDADTGVLIGTPMFGDHDADFLASDNGVYPLSSGDYVVASDSDSTGTEDNTGSARLVDGTTNTLIGTAIEGSTTNDRLANGGIVELTNGNYVIVSTTVDTGSCRRGINYFG